MKISEVFASGEPEEQAAAPAQGQPPAQPGQPAPQGQGQETNATPEEQESYDGVVMAASEVLYGEMSADIIKLLEAGKDDPPLAIARAAATIITQLDEQSGGTIPEQVIFPAAAEIAELVAELADAKGVFPVDENVIQTAGHNLVYLIAEQYDVSPEEIQEFIGAVPPDIAQKIGQQQGAVAAKAMPAQKGSPQ